MDVEYKNVFSADEFSAGVSEDATGQRNSFTGDGSDRNSSTGDGSDRNSFTGGGLDRNSFMGGGSDCGQRRTAVM